MANPKSRLSLVIRLICYSFLAIISISLIYLTVDILRAGKLTSDITKKALTKKPDILETNDLSPHQLDILIKVEDPNFYHHKGVDVKTPGAGWTTITQSLVKMYYFNSGFKPGLVNKIRQTLIARFVFDPRISKNDQLKLFINESHFGSLNGHAIIGLNNAAREFYYKPFKKLQEDEYISLIATLVAPGRLNPIRNRQENAERVRRIKRLLSGDCQPMGFGDVFLEGCK